MIYLCSTALSYAWIPKENMGEGLAAAWSEKKNELNPTSFGIMCISAAYPNLDADPADYAESGGNDAANTDGNGDAGSGANEDANGGGKEKNGATLVNTTKNNKSSKGDTKVIATKAEDEGKPRVFGRDPVV